MSTVRMLCAVVLVSALGAVSSADEWARFRGPNGSGVAPAAEGVPSEFSEADFNWKIKLPGLGHGSPSVWGNRVFVMSADPDTAFRYVLAIDAASGETVWQKEFPAGTSRLHSKSSYASCTPAIDEFHIYAAWADDEQTRLVALNHDGELSWSVDLGPWVSQHGFGTSPMLYKDKVILSLMQLGKSGKQPERPAGNSRLVAFDRQTGEKLWETPRESDVAAYSVPCVLTTSEGKELLICNSSGNGIAAHDPATGQEVWSQKVLTMRSVSSPVVADGMVLGSHGSGGGGNKVFAIDPNGGQPKLAWQMDRQASYVPTTVAKEGKIFVWYDKGIVSCLDATTGEVLGQRRVGGNFYGSPILVGDRLFCISEEGEVVVVSGDTKLELLGRSPLGEGSESTPAVAGGKMFLRTYSHLISVGK